MFGNFFMILPKIINGKRGWVYPGVKQMIGGVGSYVATWADIGYIVVKPVVVAGEVS